jgi:hypothetical protein
MGGIGSGRWGWGNSDAKVLVENCRVLDLNALVRDGVVRAGTGRVCSGLTWRRNEVAVASVRLEVFTTDTGGTLRLSYALKRGDQQKELDYHVDLETTALVSGGRRWWFRCPARRQGGPPCRRRCAKLYLPPRSDVFACRRCHDLAYASSRESRKWDSMFRELAASTGIPLADVKAGMMKDRQTCMETALIRNNYRLFETMEKLLSRLRARRPGR